MNYSFQLGRIHFVNGAHPQLENTSQRLSLPSRGARQPENRNIGQWTGTRLAQESELKPKPTVEIGGRPVRHPQALCALRRREFFTALGYKGDQIKRYVSGGRKATRRHHVAPGAQRGAGIAGDVPLPARGGSCFLIGGAAAHADCSEAPRSLLGA
jgi:hypothetical protein